MRSISETVKVFYDEINKDDNHRFKSWEHCFEYFSRDREDINNDTACLHLAFYLASWGMYRGSSYLLWKDYKVHNEVVELLLTDEYKVLQHTSFNQEDMDKIFELTEKIRKTYTNKIKKVSKVNGEEIDIYVSDTLVTKIILGTLGCAPAYDRFFLVGLRDDKISPLRFRKDSLQGIYDFYSNASDKKEIDRLAEKMNYPIMKIMDMYFWQVGYQKWLDEQEEKKLLKKKI